MQMTTTITGAATTVTFTMPNNVTVTAIGSVFEILAMALILFLIYLCRKRKTKLNQTQTKLMKNTKTIASKKMHTA